MRGFCLGIRATVAHLDPKQATEQAMTNSLAIFLGIIVIASILSDLFLTGGNNLLFLAKKFTDMTEWMAFWR